MPSENLINGIGGVVKGSGFDTLNYLPQCAARYLLHLPNAMVMVCWLWAWVTVSGLATGAPSDASSYPTVSSRLRRDRLALVIGKEAVPYAGLLSYLQFVSYQDKARVPFEFYNDSKGFQQIDKCGHAFGAYLESYYGYRALGWAGARKKPAILFGSTLGILLQSPIEIWDGLYEG